MTHRHSIARQLLLLMRDALGRFTRLRATAHPKTKARRTPRTPAACVQLTLF